MNRAVENGRQRRGIVPASLAALTIALTGCSAANDPGSDATGSGGGAGSTASLTSQSLSGTLNGGGSSAQEAAQAAWRAGFQAEFAAVTVNYDPVGSGTGRTNFLSGAYSFAGSDSALKDGEELASAKERCGGEVIEIPAYVSPIAVVFNLEGVEELNLSPRTVAQIFSGEITTWNDERIAADNPDVELPATTITPVHRSDDSGTTENFTEYLAQAADGTWVYEPDGVWPIPGGEAAEGTSGMVAAVKAGAGTIGYADESQVSGLSVVALGVGDEFNVPSAEGAAQVVANSPKLQGRGAGDLAMEINRADTSPGSYPLLMASYLIACQTYDDAEEAALVKGYLAWVVSAEGQQAAAQNAGSAPLSASLLEQAAAIVEAIS